jgi:cytidylate kinase
MTVIAIDGPSGSGKSTIARLIAERCNLPYLDTGAMYRSVGLLAIKKNVAYSDGAALVKLATEMKIQMLDERVDGHLVPRVVLNALDVTQGIRTVGVSQAASAVAVHPELRERLVKRQRTWVELRGGAVVEGRDIGTVVFPDAELKVFLTADDEERVRRRQADENAPGFQGLSTAQAEKELAERDHRDSTRAASPLTPAPDALVVDTSGRDIDEVVIGILVELRQRMGGELPAGKSR